MSTKKLNQATGTENKKGPQSRNKSRRRSSRNTSFNGENDVDTKEKSSSKRSRDLNASSKYETFDQDDTYKDIIDVVPSPDLNCSPPEMPALPGTRVTLHGVILHETHGGLIVLNVRWRNKIYSGALIDVEKSKWACDRLPSECNGGSKEFQTPPPVKKIKIPNTDDSVDIKKKGVTSPTSAKPKSKPNAKKRSNQERDTSPPVCSTEHVPAKKHKNKTNFSSSSSQNGGSSSTDGWIECPEPKCGKKYKNKNGLTCHIRKIHKSESMEESGKENKSESQEDSDSGEDNFVIDERTEEDRANSTNTAIEEKQPEQSGKEEENKPIEDEKESIDERKAIVDDASKPTLLKTEMTENERHIEKLKLETEKARAKIELFKQESVEGDNIPESDESREISTSKPSVDEKHVHIKQETMDERIKDQPPDLTKVKQEEIESESTQTTLTATQPTQTMLPPSSIPPKVVASKSETAHSRNSNDSATHSRVSSESATHVRGNNESSHPRGSSRTIIHQDNAHSLNELFSPAANNFQFSPTLSSLNPQKINDSLTNALSRQQQEKLKKITPTITSSTAPETSNPTDVVKTPLGPKPSIDFKPMDGAASDNELRRKFGNEVTLSNIIEKKNPPEKSVTSETIDCSDDESEDQINEVLRGCFKVYPQVEDEVKPPSIPHSMTLNRDASHQPSQLKSMFTSRMSNSNPFESKLMMEELGKVAFGAYPNLPTSANPQVGKMCPTSATMGGIPSNLLKGMLRFPASDSTNFSDVLTYMKQNNGQPRPNKPDDPRHPFDMPHHLLPSKEGGAPLKPNSLLEQRLLTQHPKNDLNLTKNLFLSRQFQVKEDAEPVVQSESKTNLPSDSKVSPKSLYMPREQRSFDKQKFGANNLRINPPSSIEERVNISQTWFPEVSKDPYFSGAPPPASNAGFRQPTMKSSSSSNNPVNALSADKNKSFTKRPPQPIPIAPAPQSGQQQPPLSQFVSPTSDYMPTDAEKDAAMMSRFTLSSDNRLIPSPAENRGRPRKVRGKLAQVPTSSQEVPPSKLRSPNELSLSRKPSSSPVVRASVIQGSTHPSFDNVSMVKSPERDGQPLISAMGRPFEGGVDERFINSQQHSADEKLHMDIHRNLAEKYKNLSSPPASMYFNPGAPGRSMISPSHPRPPSHSPRPDFPMSRSSPSINPDLFREGGYHQRPMERLDKLSLLNEHGRGKPEMLRSPSEHVLLPDAARKSLSPHEALQMMEAFKRETRLPQGSRFPMPPTHRQDVPHPHDISLMERRPGSASGGPEENEHARFMAMQERKRLMQAAALSQASMFGAGTPPNAPPNEHNSHHPNLFLERRDGAFLGPLSSFSNRPGEQHKR